MGKHDVAALYLNIRFVIPRQAHGFKADTASSCWSFAAAELREPRWVTKLSPPSRCALSQSLNAFARSMYGSIRIILTRVSLTQQEQLWDACGPNGDDDRVREILATGTVNVNATGPWVSRSALVPGHCHVMQLTFGGVPDLIVLTTIYAVRRDGRR